MWVVTQAYHVPPGEAWAAMGYGALRPRQLHRLTLATTELGSLSASFDDVGRMSKTYTPTAESLLAVQEATRVFEEAWQPEWDRITAYIMEHCPDEPAPGPMPMAGPGPRVTGDVDAVE